MRISTLPLFTLLFTGVLAQDRTTEDGESKITDPAQECSMYSYPNVANNLAQFPKVWDPATLLPSDSAGQEKWNSIKDSIPNTPPKGTINGDFSQFTPTYNPSDSDCWWTYKQCVANSDIYKVPEPLTVGYGFDDGPNCSHNAFYDFLQQNNQKATMFYIGSNVMNWPLEAQRGLADGHEICVHTWSHHYMTAFASQDAFAELWYTMQAIKLVVGVTPTCWRPPFGDVDNRIRAIAKGLGLDTIIWQYDSDDWQVSAGKATPDQVDGNYQNFINNAKNGKFNSEGAIILTHELNNYTMSEAMKWYPAMKEAFQAIAPVGVAYNKTQPYVESDHTQPSFADCTCFVLFFSVCH
ncbi:carbohydrate esterase family 4 protein [Marasmius fiardii PR-910]|nr:carbohydrate esterase family 4 protein [Marasmius fiardii PR-910]